MICLRSRATALAALGLLAVALVAAGLADAPAAAAKPRHHRSGLILGPKAHQRVPARPVLIKVRAPRGAKHFRARLNGHPIGRHFSRPRHRVRKLKASLCYGLRHGHNRLRVRVGKRTQRVGFRVRRNRPLVCAGFDRTTSVGAKVRFRGRHRPRGRRSSPSSVLSAKGPGGGASYKWTVVSAPPLTETQGIGELKRHGRTASFKPTVSGRYKLRLRVTTGAGKAAAAKGRSGTRASDTTSLRVLPSPQAPIETMAHDDAGNWGVSVGSGTGAQFYADPGHSKAWLQLVVLKATTLELVDNKSFDCPEATDHPYVTDPTAVQRCTKQLLDYVKGLRTSGQPLVVIAVSQPPAPGQPDYNNQAWAKQPPVGVLESLYGIGGPVPSAIRWQRPDAPMLRGTLSVIGYVGFNPGGATYHANLNLSGVTDTGEIQGSLLADNQAPQLYSTFISPEQGAFNTQAAGSTATTNVMSIKGFDYSESIGPGKGGFQLVLLDRSDLRPQGGSFFYDTHTNIATAHKSLTDMADQIDGLAKGGDHADIVLLTTIGNPQLPPYNDNQAAAKHLVDVLQGDLGASRLMVYKALDPHLGKPSDTSYTLIGVPGLAQPGEALEAQGGQTASGLNGVPLSGYLDRSTRDYGFQLESGAVGDELGNPGQKLRDLAFGTPTDDWPEREPGCQTSPGDGGPKGLDDAGCEAAVNWIATRMLGDSNRGLYWTQPYTKEFWDDKKADIAKCTYNDPRPKQDQCNYTGGASAADFQWAQSELEQEISWLESVNGYVTGTFTKPFADSLSMLSSDSNSIATQIDNLVGPKSSADAEVKLDLFLNGLRQSAISAAALIPGVGEVAETVNAAWDTALEWGRVGSEGTEAGSEFKVTAAEVTSTVARSLRASLDTLQNQMVGVIASDYTKLKTLGICSHLDTSTCPDAGQWQLTHSDQSAAEKLIRNSIRTTLYTALLPAKYQAWRMPISANRSTNWNGSQAAGQDITGWHCPFHDSPDSAVFAYPVQPDLRNPGSQYDQWQVIAYAYETGAGTLGSPYVMNLPPAKVTDPLFQPVTNDGLGIGLTSAEPFYRQAFGNANTDGFDHFPLTDSSTRWITKDTPGFKHSECGY